MPVKFPQLPAEGRTSERIQAEQIKLLYANAPFALAITILNALMLVLLQWAIDYGGLLAWRPTSSQLLRRVQLAQELKRDQPDLRTLFVSGYSDHSAVESATRERGTAFLQKPFTEEGPASKDQRNARRLIPGRS